MRKVIRFSDMKAAGLVKSWPALLYWIEHCGFPPGHRLGKHARAWFEDEVMKWFEARRIKSETSDAV